ncbi:MAG: protein kinase [Polyangiaceae bacterium]|nr:protein kinase [Polyangiaceae bacterium]
MFPVEAVPERIGAYQVLKHVGRSGAADVYTARMDGPLGFTRDVTLKLVSAGIDEDVQFAEELAREAAICSRLNHPVVMRMFDFFEYDRRFVLVLEQVEGASLDRLIHHLTRRRQKVGDAGIFFLAGQLGAALAHAHASTDEEGNLSPVIHRDIKPENVLIGWDGNVHLAGFGLGKILGRTPDSVAGTIRGTPGYMSPEQARGERATVRSDVYGFGILLWSLLTGREPPTDGIRPEPLAEARPDLPRELLAAVDASLEPAPDRRRITCAEMVQWLSKLTKPETGREELRQKVLWLRATRGPTSKVDTTQKQARMPKRRQAIQATRPSVRRPGGPASSRPPSYGPPSSRVPPSSRHPSSQRAAALRSETPPDRLPPPPSIPPGGLRARGGTARPEISRSAFPTARPAAGDTEEELLLRLPPPPALPNSARGSVPAAPTFGPRPPNGHAESVHAKPVNGASSAPSQTPANGASNGAANGASTTQRPVSVRTVTTPPGARTTPPAGRHALAANDVLSAAQAPAVWPQEPPPFQNYGDSPAKKGPDTQRPARPAAMTFTLTTQLLLAGLTAALVVTVGILIGDRNRSASASPPPPQVVTVELNRGNGDGATGAPSEPRKTAAAEPAQSATGSAIASKPSAEPTASPAPTSKALASAVPAHDSSDIPPLPDPSTVPDTLGYIYVKGPIGTDVYLNGVKRGATNEALLVPCGHFFLRLAPKDSNGPFKAWLGPGQSALVACKSATIVTTKITTPTEATPSPYRKAQIPPKGVGL